MRFVLLLVAAVIAVVAAVAALQMSSNQPPANSAAAVAPQNDAGGNVATVEVLTARQAIPVGTVIDDSMVDKQPWPSHLVLDSFITSTSKDAVIAGRVARASFQPHEPFIRSKLANPNDPSFLAAALPEGMRAVTMATDAISGVAGYVFPGDRVDVLLTHSLPDAVAKNAGVEGFSGNGKPTFTEVLIPNVKVLAVNLREPTGKEGAQVVMPSSITIETTDVYAQQLRLAEKNGTLSLALRSLKDRDTQGMPKPAGIEDLSQVRVSVSIVRGVGKGSGRNTNISPRAEGSDDAAAALFAPEGSSDSGVQPMENQ